MADFEMLLHELERHAAGTFEADAVLFAAAKRAIRREFDAQAARIAELEAQNERLKGVAAICARRSLLREMRELSENLWCAGWLDGIEYTLWEHVIGEDELFTGLGILDAFDRDTLKGLAQQAGGWWYWDYVAPKFVPMPQWLEMYAVRKARELLESQ